MKSNTIKRICSLIMALVIVVGLLPVSAFAANNAVVVLSASDYQQKGSDPQSNTASILSQIKADYASADGFLFGGDYYQDTLDTTTKSKEGKAELDASISAAYPNLANRVYIQGNHDADSLVSDGTLSSTGAHDTANYGVYAINEMDYPWGWQASNSFQSTCQNTANALDAYLDAKVDAGYNKPIFVITHVPLHYTPRTSSFGDGKYAKYLYDVLDEAGEKGLNIIFLFGHNHSNTYDDYIGGGQIYLPKGSNICVANEGNTSSYFTDTLNFTYMNCGYVGYIGGQAGTNLSISVFEITNDQVIVKRYGSNGLVELKAAGKTTSGAPAADTSTVASGAVISLGAPIPVVSFTDNNVTVSSAGLTGLSAYKNFGTGNTAGYDTDAYSAYASYEVTPEGYIQGKSATVTIALDTADGFTTAKSVVVVNRETGDEQRLTITDGAVSFVATDFGTIDIMQETSYDWVSLPSGNTYVLDTDGIDSGAKYLIVAESYAKALTAASSSNNAADITINGNEATADDTMGWTITASGSNYTIQKDGTYLNRSSSSLASGSSSSTWTVSSQGSGKYNVTQSGGSSSWGSSSSYYLRWSNSNNYFQASSSNKNPVRLYKHTGSGSDINANYIRLAGKTTQSYTASDAATLNTVLSKVMIQTSADSTSADSVSIPVTSEMVIWSPAFDASVSGTYVGTVVCEDQTMGTITVTISVEHNFETTTVEATCAEPGSITSKCTICGEETVEIIPATGEHDYISVTVDATCTEAGSVTHTCKVCGDSYADPISALGHTFSSIVTAPTCTTAGYTTYTCETCGTSEQKDATNALGHNYTTSNSASCTEDGFIIHTCTVCGDTYNGDAVTAFGHEYSSTVTAPTCATAGYTTYVCSACGHTYTGNEVDALGHNYASAVTAPTCTANGFTTYTCETCGHSYTGNEVLALGHDYESVITEPTFETEGYTTHTCTVCGDVKVDSYVPVLTHTYETVTQDATCETNGFTKYTCTDCGYSYTDVLEATGHAYTSVTTAATCTENGSIVSTCATCGNVARQTIPATGHDLTSTTIDPTCESVGYTTYTCACGYVETTEIPALGHDYTIKHVDATCTTAGSTTYTCTVCADTRIEVGTVAGHTYESSIVAPTCTKIGYTVYTCTACRVYYNDNYVSATGHSNIETVTPATCTTAGYTTHTCENCGHTSTSNTVAALGHNYVSSEGNGYVVYTCTNSGCTSSYTEEVAGDFTYNKVTKLTNNKTYVITLYSSGKYYALSHKNDTLSPVQVTVSNNQITSDVTEDMLWDYNNKKLFYADDNTTNYLYAASTGLLSTPKLQINASKSTNVSISGTKFKVGSYYLRYSNSTASLSKSASTVYLFNQVAN